MFSNFKIIFSWIWPIILPTIMDTLLLGEDAVKLVYEEVVKIQNDTTLTGAQKFQYVFDKTKPQLLKMGKSFTSGMLKRVIEIAVRKMKADFGIELNFLTS